MTEEQVILVDEHDNEIGLMEKMQVHREGRLHRAFSVFLFNYKGEVLLQQRAFDKYHCGGLWTNTCCSHPRKGESLQQAVNRRLQEELGISCETEEVHSFIYKADVGEGLIEHEYDHVFVGKFSGIPQPNTAEIADWKYVNLDFLREDIEANPQLYTPWFRIILDNFDVNYLKKG